MPQVVRAGVDDWLAQQFMLLGWTFQNWMVVILTLILAAMLVASIEDG